MVLALTRPRNPLPPEGAGASDFPATGYQLKNFSVQVL